MNELIDPDDNKEVVEVLLFPKQRRRTTCNIVSEEVSEGIEDDPTKHECKVNMEAGKVCDTHGDESDWIHSDMIGEVLERMRLTLRHWIGLKEEVEYPMKECEC